MKERPILFSGPMVRALLDGRKTQTRRLVRVDAKTTRVYWAADVETVPRGRYTGWVRECDAPLALPIKCPYGIPGDRLWVRETWAPFAAPDDEKCAVVAYRASCTDDAITYVGKDGSVRDIRINRWTSGIYMPREASRLLLEVTEVRVERLQDISEEDACAEGVARINGAGGAVYPGTGAYRRPGSYRHAFETLWDGINGKRAPWASNPWVWVVSFKRIEEGQAVNG